MNQYCPWEPAQYLIFSANVPSILYYALLPGMIVSLLVGFYLLAKKKDDLSIHSLVGMFLLFSVWGFLALFLFATNSPSDVMFFWSLTILVEPAIYLMGVLFTYRFLYNKDLSFTKLVLLLLPWIPIVIFLPTGFNLEGVKLSDCTAIEGPVAQYYTYLIEIIYSILILGIVSLRYYKETDKLSKNNILYLGVGILLFFTAFSSGNIIGSFTNDWIASQYGYFGMPIFVGFLAYIIVKYRAFDIKLIAAQVLIVSLVVLIGSEFFFIQNNTNRILTAITLVITGAIGINLIRSVKKEIEQRERIEKLAGELQDTNERQETLIHFIGHEVKGFLTKDAGAFASLADGDFGPLPEALKPFVTQALAQSRDGANSVTDILTASNQKKGTVSYTKEPFDLKALAEEIVDKAKPMAEGKGLELSISTGDVGTPYIFTGDRAKIGDNVFRNIIENSLHYTPSGTVAVSLKKDPSTGLGAGEKFIFAVKDTGIGITEEDKKRLFTEGGHGKDSQKVNVHSTGYGLYIAKNIVEAHNGTIRAESEGEGKGSTFVVELPIG